MEKQEKQIEYNKFEKINIYLTGYGPFDSIKVNPAEQVANYLYENKDKLNTKHTSILYNQIFEVKTEYVDQNKDKLFQFIQKNNTDKKTLHIIVSFGVAQNRLVNTIETLAQNYIYDLIKDQKIDKTKPDRFYSKNPAKKIAKGIRNLKEVECKFSNNAGTYLCNYMYYTTLTKYLNDDNVCSFFIHVPSIEHYGLDKHEKYFRNFISILEDLYIIGNEEKRNKILNYTINDEEDEHIDSWEKKKREKKKEKKKKKKNKHKKENEKDCKESKKKSFKIIPIIAHKSEKPSISYEEINAGKMYPSIYNFKTSKNQEKDKNIKVINKETPTIAPKNEKPKNVKEKGKFLSVMQSSLNNMVADKKKKEKKVKDGKKIVKKEKAIIVHESEKPSCVFEEVNFGKSSSNIQTSITNYKEKKQNKKESKPKPKKNIIKNNKIYKNIPIIAHDSENPSIVFEEISAGNLYKNFKTSVTQYKNDNKNKKVKKSTIIIHESEKPSITFEQINSGKLYSKFPTTQTNLKEIKKLKKVVNEFKEIPIVEHNSELPSIVFEETNTGIKLDFHH